MISNCKIDVSTLSSWLLPQYRATSQAYEVDLPILALENVGFPQKTSVIFSGRKTSKESSQFMRGDMERCLKARTAGLYPIQL